jgi:hypothetical protein
LKTPEVKAIKHDDKKFDNLYTNISPLKDEVIPELPDLAE